MPLPIEQVLELLVCALVDDTASAIVTTKAEAEHTTLMVIVAREDIGKVIGKQGRTARSIRTVLSAASIRADHRYVLDIREQS